MKDPHPLDVNIGILGGGQLARMMCLAAHELGFRPYVLSSSTDDPAAQVTNHWIEGHPGQAEDIQRLLAHARLITFESEFFPMEPIEFLGAQDRCFPHPQCMRQIQDRRLQKKLLEQHKIPTAAFLPINDPEDLLKAWEIFPKGFVLKKAQGGYDGYGTYFLTGEKETQDHQMNWRGPYIAERKLHFLRELAIMFFRNPSGDFTAFPLVESVQKNAKCDLIFGPINHAGLQALTRRFRRFMDRINYVGALGVELFETKEGLFVNELAPRVHNSGHYSQNALSQSQFHMHLKAILDLPLKGATLLNKSFVMANLIGESERAMKIPPGLQGALHWYGKTTNKPGRKMGHLNYVGPSRGPLLKLAASERRRIQK